MLKNFSESKSIIYFLLGCIPIRLLFVVILKYIDTKYLSILSIPLFIQSFGFLYLYFGYLRLKAPEAGGNSWWANLRLIHGMLYLTSSIYAFKQKDVTWIPLFIDVLVGLIAFLIHRKFLSPLK